MTAKLFEAALGIAEPWLVASVDFDEKAKTLTVLIDFKPGTRFGISGHEGAHPVHDTVTKTYRHLNFFQHECHLQVRTPRVKLPNCSVRLVELDFAGRLNGFTLLFEALILMLARQMPFAAVARIVGESPHRVLAVCQKYVEMACGLADYSDVTALAIDETSRARGHSYVTLAADGGFSVYNLQGTVDLIIDVVGVYSDHHHDDRYYTRAEIDEMVQPSGSIAIDAYTAFLTPSIETERIVENNYCVRAAPKDLGLGSLSAGGLWAAVPLPAGTVVNTITVHSFATTAQPFTISLGASQPDGSGRSLASSATVRSAGPGATSLTIDVTDQTPLAQHERLRLFFHGWTAAATASLCSVTVHYS